MQLLVASDKNYDFLKDSGLTNIGTSSHQNFDSEKPLKRPKKNRCVKGFMPSKKFWTVGVGNLFFFFCNSCWIMRLGHILRKISCLQTTITMAVLDGF